MTHEERIANIIQTHGKQIHSDFTLYKDSSKSCIPSHTTAQYTYEYLGHVWLIIEKYTHTTTTIHPAGEDYDGYFFPESVTYTHHYVFDSYSKIL